MQTQTKLKTNFFFVPPMRGVPVMHLSSLEVMMSDLGAHLCQIYFLQTTSTQGKRFYLPTVFFPLIT